MWHRDLSLLETAGRPPRPPSLLLLLLLALAGSLLGFADAGLLKVRAGHEGWLCLDHQAVNSENVYVYNCHGRINQQWYMEGRTIRTREAQGKCLEWAVSGDVRVKVKSCDGSGFQDWYVQDRVIHPCSGVIGRSTYMYLDTCLTVNNQKHLYFARCGGGANQLFQGEFLPQDAHGDLLQVKSNHWNGMRNCVDYDAPALNIKMCSAHEDQLWWLSASGELHGYNGLCVEARITDGTVLLAGCNEGLSQKWGMEDDGHIFLNPPAQFSGGAGQHCLEADTHSSRLVLRPCSRGLETQIFLSSVMHPLSQAVITAVAYPEKENCLEGASNGDRAYLRPCHSFSSQRWNYNSDQQLQTQGRCLEFDNNNYNNRVSLQSCSLSRSTQRWTIAHDGHIFAGAEHVLNKDCLQIDSATADLHTAECSTSSHQLFRSDMFPKEVLSPDAMESLRGKHYELYRPMRRAIADWSDDHELVPEDVLEAANDFMTMYNEERRSYGPQKAAAWRVFAQDLIFGHVKEDLATTPWYVLLQTTEVTDAAVALLMWGHLTAEESEEQGWAPGFHDFGDKIYEARLAEVQHRLYAEDAEPWYVHSYFDGLTSDMGRLTAEMLPRVCARHEHSLCKLMHLGTLVRSCRDVLATQSLEILDEGHWPDETTLELGERLANVSASQGTHNTPLWRDMVRFLLLGSLTMGPLREDQLLFSTLSSLMPGYLSLSSSTPGLEYLHPHFEYITNKITAKHYEVVTQLLESRDLDGLGKHISPNLTEATSDLHHLARGVLPRLCTWETLSVLAICKLQVIHSSLQQTLGFEHARRAKTRLLSDLSEVDVMRQLDVVHSELEHIEVIMTVQTAANDISELVQTESLRVRELVRTESQDLRNQIAQSTQALSGQLGNVGHALQTEIQASTQELHNTIGQAANQLRHDIASNTRLLWTKMDAEARSLHRSIQENTAKLSYQIGDEARRTRSLVQQSTATLYNKIGAEGQAIRRQIDHSTNLLYKKIGDEGAATRHDIDVSTERLYNKIGEEGRATRSHIDTKTSELSTLINTRTSELSDQIDYSTNKAITTFKTGIGLVGKYFQSKDRVAVGTLRAQLVQSRSATNQQLQKVPPLIDQLMEKMGTLKTDAIDEDKSAKLDLMARGAIAAAKIAEAVCNCVNPLSFLGGNCDPADMAEQEKEVTNIAAQGQALAAQEDLVMAAIAGTVDMSSEMSTVLANFHKMYDKITAMSKSIEDFLADSSESSTEDFSNDFLAIYRQFEIPMSQAQIQGFESVTDSCYAAIERLISVAGDGSPQSGPGTTLAGAVSHSKSISNRIWPLMSEIYESLNADFERIAHLAVSAVGASSSRSIENWSKSRRLRGVEATSEHPSFKPLYSLAYATVAKLLVERKVQRAGFHFCNLYTYRLGQAPAMCAHNFYTSDDISAMRSFRPPQPRVTRVIARLPTSPPPFASSSPYFDFRRLAENKSVSFALPEDNAWLAHYGWTSWGESATTVKFIKSLSLVFPYASSSGSPGLNPFQVLSRVSFSPYQTQGQDSFTYALPSMEVSSTISMHDDWCWHSMTNPYHQVAGCITPESSLCVHPGGSVLDDQILPTLHSMITFSPPVTNGQGFDLVLPPTKDEIANGSPTMDLVVVADIAVINRGSSIAFSSSVPDLEASLSASAANATEMTSSCCGSDEFRRGGRCRKCPDGLQGALHGYACQPAA